MYICTSTIYLQIMLLLMSTTVVVVVVVAGSSRGWKTGSSHFDFNFPASSLEQPPPMFQCSRNKIQMEISSNSRGSVPLSLNSLYLNSNSGPSKSI